MSAADDAYREAERLIAEAKRTGAEELSFDKKQTRALEALPPQIGDLDALRRLDLNNTRIADLAPLAGLTALTTLRLDGTGVSDLAPLAGLTALTTLWLGGTGVSDIAPLAGLTALTTLLVNDTGVTDIAPLAGLTALTTLGLNGTGVSDLAPLAGLTALTTLWLGGTGVTDIAPLAGLTALTTLWLDDTGVSDLAPLAGLTALTTLGLNGTGVTDIAPLAGLTALTTLWLDDTGVSDLAPLAGLTALTTLWLDDTGVSDLAPLAGLTALRSLSLIRCDAFDLRPLRALRQTLVPSANALRGEQGILFSDTPATRADQRLAEIAAIEDHRERTRQFFDHLETWEPPGTPGDASPEPDSLLPVSVEDGRLEIAASVPTEAERDERLKRVLHERLKAKAPDLAQAAGNRFPRLAARARALVREVDRPFEQLDMLLIHMEVDDLSASLARGAEREGEEAFTPDVVDALSDVARIGPGLTLDHPDVELLEERKRRYAADPPASDAKAAHDSLSKAASEDAGAIGDNLRRLEGEIAARPESDTSGAVQVSVHRNMLIRIGRSALSDSKQIVLGAAGSALFFFVHSNWPTIQTVAASYGPAFMEWFLTAMLLVRESAGLAANVEWRPVNRKGKKAGD